MNKVFYKYNREYKLRIEFIDNKAQPLTFTAKGGIKNPPKDIKEEFDWLNSIQEYNLDIEKTLLTRGFSRN